MSAPALSPTPTMPAVAPAVARQGVLAKVVTWWTRFQNRRQVSNLLALDDYLLKDLGVARGDVFEALTDPLTSDPSSLLAASAAQRRISERARIREHLRSARLMDSFESNEVRRAA
ncbi:DUF1127 domain-containing protein [Alsobacter sp. R-9]